MKLIQIIFLLIFSCNLGCERNDKNKEENVDSEIVKLTQKPEGSNDAKQISMDNTLDIVTWNLEWFGAPWKSKNSNSISEQLNSVTNKIREINADVYALQEVVIDYARGDNLKILVDELNKGEDIWEGVYSDSYYYFSNDYPSQRICYIYKKETVIKMEAFPMFKSEYSSGNADWASGRLPFRLKAEVNINGNYTEIQFINIHAKCCKSKNSPNRRRNDAVQLIKKLNTTFLNDNVIVLGDYNDYINKSMDGGSSPYEVFYVDNNKYYKHVVGTGIDHISISNELYDEFDALKNNSKKYNVTISDHDPHMVRLWLKYKK